MTLVTELLRVSDREFGRPLKRQYLKERWDSHVGQKILSFPSFWIESLHLHCKGGEDELRERNGLLGVVGMRRGVEKIAMGVSRFVEHRSGKSITIDRHQNV